MELARAIVDYLCRRRMNAGNHVTEQELVQELGVSRSPIRATLAYLAEKGVFVHRENRGYFLHVGHDVLERQGSMFPLSTIESSIDTIMRDWFESTEQRTFSTSAFRRRWGLSQRGTERILRRLAQRGVVTENRGSGWLFVPPPNTWQRRAEAYMMRMAVEPAAILAPTFELDYLQAAHARALHEEALRTAPEQLDADTLTSIDAEFHRLIGVSSRNLHFQAAIERHNTLRSVNRYARSDLPRRLASCAEHMTILDALERADHAAAAELMRSHLRAAGEADPWGTGRRGGAAFVRE